MKSDPIEMNSNKPLFIKISLKFSVLALFFTSIIVMPQASAHEVTIFSNSKISNGQVDPAPIFEGVGFADDNDKFDFTVDMGKTNLEYDSVAFINSTHMRFNFHGTAAEGSIFVTAESSAFGPGNHTSNTFEIIIRAPLILQTISFAEISPMTVGGADRAPIISASSNLTVEFTSNTQSVCTNDFGKIHAVAAGTCSMTASQLGNSDYAAAPVVTRTFTVLANPATVSSVAKPVVVPANLGSYLYDPTIVDDSYASILVAGINGSFDNSNLVKLLIPPNATSSKVVFLVSALSSDEESAAGYFVARIKAVTADGGSIRSFKKPIEINIPAGAKDGFLYWSFDEVNWYRLPKIESKLLPTNLHAAYFVETDGRIAIFSDYLMYFGFRKEQAPLKIISPVEKLTISTSAATKSDGGSGTGSINYRSSTESICTITSAGVITGLDEGKCLITANKQRSGFFANARSNVLSISVNEITPTIKALPKTFNTGFLTHSLTFMQSNDLLTLDVALCSIYALETADLLVGSKAKNGRWTWQLVSNTKLDENGAGVFTIAKRFSPGQIVRISVNGVIQMESDV